MDKIAEAQDILKTLGLPEKQQNELSALILLALCNVKRNDSWSHATREARGISKGIMKFLADEYDRKYAANTRETIRKDVLHYFVQAHIAEYNPFDPTLPTNSPKAHYAVSPKALEVIKTYGTAAWKQAADEFLEKVGSLKKIYDGQREQLMVPVTLPNGNKVKLSPGVHNELQAAIVEKFAPQFAPGAFVLYLGDTTKKDLISDNEKMAELGIPINQHDKLPDVVLYSEQDKWLYLIEAVTSRGPMSNKRVIELEDMFSNCKAGIVYVTAFLTLKDFKKHASDIAWETEVWIADKPQHMIHFNGDRFLGPR